MKYTFSLFIFFCLTLNTWSQDQPPSITIVGNTVLCENSGVSIVTDATITDPDATDTTLGTIYVQISEGYSIGEDILVLTGTHPNVNSSWSPNEGELTLIGPATFAEFELAIEAIEYQTTQTNFTQDKSFSINLGNANYLPSTDHYYFYVADLGISWTNARDAAATLDFFGLQGYLATITTAEEAQLSGEQSPGAGWIGANDATIDNNWQWVTGPEAGTTFWIGLANGAPVNGEFSFWNTGEPNNFGGNESYAHITDPSVGASGSWNDLPIGGDSDVNSAYHPKGYLVEFGGMPGDPVVNLSAGTTLVTPKSTVSFGTVCQGVASNISVTTNTDTVQWYDSQTATTPIFTGLTYNPVLTQTTTFWVEPLFNGCTAGIRIPVTAVVNPLPITQDITIFQCDDSTVIDGLTSFNVANSESQVMANDNGTFLFEYYLEASHTTQIDGSNFNNTTNPQTIYVIVTNAGSGCQAFAEITLQVNNANTNAGYLETCDNAIEDGLAEFDLSQADSQILTGLPMGTTLAYYPTYDDALLEANLILGNTFTNTEAYNQTIYARVEQAGNCYAITALDLVVLPLPEVEVDDEVFYCLNTYPSTIPLSGGIINDNPSNYTYNWSTGQTTQEIQVNEIGVYTVEVTGVQCSKTRTITVLPSNIAIINTIEVNDNSDNNTITVLVSGEGDYIFALDNSNGPYQEENTFTNVVAGFHTVYVKDVKNNCGIINKEVSVIGYPKFFTPNGDNVNETWQINGISSANQSIIKLYIYNRYGKLLKQINSADGSWDGTFKGEKLPASDYWFVVTLQNGRNFTGHFTLKL